jgi:hypothetical protein
MLWAALVAGGVAIVSMAIFGARLTRKPEDDPQTDLVLPATDVDPSDPWAAWQPRPFEDLDRVQRPRMWPVMASLTGLILVGGGLAGARQAITEPDIQAAADSTPEPFTIEVKVTPTPTPVSTPTPRPATPKPAVATARPQTAAAAPAPAAAGGPTITGSAACASGKAKLTFTVKSQGANLSWIGVYLDGKVTGGGPTSAQTYSGGVERPTTPGDHTFEVSAQDKAGKSSRKQWQVRCA